MKLTHERLREVLGYDQQAGALIWLKTLSVRGPAGKVAGGLRPDGRRQIRIDGTLYLTSRLVWFWHHGEFPPLEVDHANCDPLDNRIENLRLATRKLNEANKRPYGKLGYPKGVYYDVRRGNYHARVKTNGRFTYLGAFSTPDAASAAYAVAAKKVFGEFARAE